MRRDCAAESPVWAQRQRRPAITNGTRLRTDAWPWPPGLIVACPKECSSLNARPHCQKMATREKLPDMRTGPCPGCRTALPWAVKSNCHQALIKKKEPSALTSQTGARLGASALALPCYGYSHGFDSARNSQNASRRCLTITSGTPLLIIARRA